MVRLFVAVFFIFCITAVAARAGDCEYNRTDEKTCMQCNIYHEGRGLDINEQLLIGLTTLERVKSDQYPNTICEVVWQHRQFSWTQDGRSDRPKEKESWKSLTNLVDLLLMAKDDRTLVLLPADMSEKQIKGMMWYHTNEINPPWAKNLKLIKQFRGHRYYKQ